MYKFMQVNGANKVSNARNGLTQNTHNNNRPRRRIRNSLGNIFERYHITVKPKLLRSSSLSDLATHTSDFIYYAKLIDIYNHVKVFLVDILDKPIEQSDSLLFVLAFDFIKDSNKFLSHRKYTAYQHCSGDTIKTQYGKYLTDKQYMSWNIKGKKPKKKIDMSPEQDSRATTDDYEADQNMSSYADNSSVCSTDEMNLQRLAAFPFISTPSGNLKVQSNQVVFQSSTVGVLLADPTQAKVKVKFEGKAAGEPENRIESHFIHEKNVESQVKFTPKEPMNSRLKSLNDHHTKSKIQTVREEQGKDLGSLGYALAEPIDWMRVQLPKKLDLFQEFYRRIINYINTDTIVHIGDEEFHCHQIVLQIYSAFFDMNNHREIELPISNVSPEAFQTIYEWMIFSGPESNKVLKRENILDLFCAAQYLAIKDLEDQCWSFIVHENLFTEDTAFALYREARSRGMTPVMDLMVPRVMRFFLPLVASRDFLELEPDEVMTFLKSNYICVTSEIEVLMAGVRWLYGNWPARRRLVVDIMRCIRFGLISPWQLVDIKRNPDNAEILEIVNDPEVQQMVDDGLAWNHVTYKDFLNYLEHFMVPKDQMYQQMSLMQPPRRNDDLPGTLRGMEDKMEMRRPKMDFPLPTTLKGLGGDKDKSFPTMSEFFENRRKTPQHSQMYEPPEKDSSDNFNTTKSGSSSETAETSYTEKDNETLLQISAASPTMVTIPREKTTPPLVSTQTQYMSKATEKRQNSVAACYLAAATAALAESRRESQISPTSGSRQITVTNSRSDQSPRTPGPHLQNNISSPQVSLFNQSKESLAKVNMNKLSTSILGPTNKSYTVDGSLFNWDRETVLVFGGINPHASYGVGRNTGKDIFRFDPLTNSWDYVGDLPEPRHHHSVAFLRGRVYLVGGADPRDDDTRGKSVVVSTVWSYEPVTRSWYSESGLAVPRKNFGLVVHRMALYAIGGQDKKGRVLRSVERFDPKAGSWSEVRSMNVARMAMASVKYRDYIWVAGGMTGEKKNPVCKLVECYNSKTNEWTEIYSLRFPRCFSTLFAMNDKLYIIGGAGKISEKDKTPSSVGAIDIWDWKERVWKQETELSIPRHGHALAYLGTQLIIIGGVTTIYMRALSNVESFCCERGAWIRGVATLPLPLSGHGAVTLPPASLM
ncbi:unnamed protein product [Parnassius apollo]|uniref:(apollo) hypothetical protein n=1 Tax=Parnassius apollo TaxID=110799 RepID=A0A8S3WYQ9_PARAO|nr:unnamed protein product [Parnassius apollo]